MEVVEEQSQNLLDSGIGFDLRGIPPSRAWLLLLKSKPDVEVIRAYVKGQFTRGVLEVNSGDSSWSGESLLHIGAVLDRLLSQLGLQAVGTPAPGRPSVLSEEVERIHAERVAVRRRKREEYLASRAKPDSGAKSK